MYSTGDSRFGQKKTATRAVFSTHTAWLVLASLGLFSVSLYVGFEMLVLQYHLLVRASESLPTESKQVRRVSPPNNGPDAIFFALARGRSLKLADFGDQLSAAFSARFANGVIMLLAFGFAVLRDVRSHLSERFDVLRLA